MFARTIVRTMGGVVVWTAAAVFPVSGQVSGHIVLASGPIGVSVVFGPEGARRVERRRRVTRVVRYEEPVPVRYRRGMSLAQLELYMERIDYEYDLYRRMRPDEAHYHLGWTRGELRDYVRWLRDERKFLRDEHRRLTRLYRPAYVYSEYRRGRGHPGRGRGVARGNPHR